MLPGSHELYTLRPACQTQSKYHTPANWGSPSETFANPPTHYFFLGGTTASLKAFAKRNLTTVLAGILIGAPV